MHSFTGAIIQSLRQKDMVEEFPRLLLTPDKGRIRKFDERLYWDYKEEIDLNSPIAVANLAKDILGFHNSQGGVIIFGITDNFKVRPISSDRVPDSGYITNKLRKYFPVDVPIFREQIEIKDGFWIYLIFVEKSDSGPLAVASNGPDKRGRRPLFVAGDLFYRNDDQTRRCVDEVERQRVFSEASFANVEAYALQVDESMFRLLNPNFEQFFGREDSLIEIENALLSRNHIIALDGQGGVGKSAIAIHLIRKLYDSNSLQFIISASAKSRIWVGHTAPVQASFGGIKSLLQIIATTFELEATENTERLRSDIIQMMEGERGILLIDNAEDIDDPAIFKFLQDDVPDPVKVLVTTRMDKSLGARTISIPEMTHESALELFTYELSKHGNGSFGKKSELIAVLELTGNVPLAIKWAASLVHRFGSLKSALQIFEGSSSDKQEFLSFCFENMFQALGNDGKNCAMLFPYFGESWTAHTLALALDIDIERVRASQHEISDAGLMSSVQDGHQIKFLMLPLARQFLSQKLERSPKFESKVRERLTDVFSASPNAILADWSPEKKFVAVMLCAYEHTQNNRYRRALKLTQLARTYRDEPSAVFHEGSLKYRLGSPLPGHKLMRRAAKNGPLRQSLNIHDAELYFLSACGVGSAKEKKDALEVFLTTEGQLPELDQRTIANLTKLLLWDRRYKELVDFSDRAIDSSNANKMGKELIPQLSNTQLWKSQKKRGAVIRKWIEKQFDVRSEDFKTKIVTITGKLDKGTD